MNTRFLICVLSLLVTVPFGGSVATAQRGPMDTCQSMAACDAAAEQILAEAANVLNAGRTREAARKMYPAVLSRKTSPQVRAAAANTLSQLLVSAGLYEYAAVQKRNAIEATRAPASAELLEHARLLAKAARKEPALAAYGEVEALALASANLAVIDGVIADYTSMGERARALALQARRPEAKARADVACAQVNCRAAPTIDAKIAELGPVEFPREARRQRGNCTVTLNVTETGKPVNLASRCNDPVFIEAAMVAVQESRFTVRYENGMPAPQYNVVMPFAFDPG